LVVGGGRGGAGPGRVPAGGGGVPRQAESIDCESATCSWESDRVKLRREIHNSGCAFPALDTAVHEGLRKQFVAYMFTLLAATRPSTAPGLPPPPPPA